MWYVVMYTRNYASSLETFKLVFSVPSRQPLPEALTFKSSHVSKAAPSAFGISVVELFSILQDWAEDARLWLTLIPPD